MNLIRSICLATGLCIVLPAPRIALADVIRVNVDDVAIQIKRSDDTPKGRYLVSLNYAPNIADQVPPFVSYLLSIESSGATRTLRKFVSKQAPAFVIDLKPQANGLYTYALSRSHLPLWVSDMRMLDPRDGAEVIPPKGYPVHDDALDAHETVVSLDDALYFLYYRRRVEAAREYVDMEVTGVSATTGERFGFWTSKGLFPASMTGDYLHFNSLYPMAREKVLASARGTNALYVLNLATGRIDETIDAATWKIRDDPFNGFARQHFANLLSNGNLLMYDNRDGTKPNARSRAVEYEVDWNARELRLVWQREVEGTIPFRFGWGSAAATSVSTRLIGWGDYSRAKAACRGLDDAYPVFSHVRKSGDVLFELRAPCGWATYRAYFIPD